MQLRPLRLNAILMAFLILVLNGACSTNTQCLQGICSGKLSEPEKQALQQSPFVAENSMTDIWSEVSKDDVYFANREITEYDSARPANGFPAAQEDTLVPSQHCSQEKFKPELLAALEEAAAAKIAHQANPNRPLKIPVQFTFSFGSVMDDTGYAAYRRSILRADDDGITPVFIAPPQEWRYSGPTAKYYQANHERARSEYMKGEKCFFSTIEVSPNQTQSGAVSAIHGENIMYYGDHYGAVYGEETITTRNRRAAFSPRLFTEIENISFGPQLNSVQHSSSINYLDAANANLKNVIPLYVADIRQGRLGAFPIVRPEFASSASRRLEYFASLRTMLDLPSMHKNFSCIASQMGRNYEANGYTFGAYDRNAISQLLRNLVYSGNLEGVMTPRQYTPLVLDLGEAHIRTSSSKNGTYFNLANLVSQVEDCHCDDPGKFYSDRLETLGVPHRTAWLGGKLEQAVCADQSCSQAPYWQLTASDGFLVTLDKNEQISSGANLFGDQRLAGNGKMHPHGFEALAKLANIDCSSNDPKKRLVGPWMDELYFDTLRVWIDRNRDGISEDAEIQTLAQAHVAAINPCHIYKEKEGLRDRFGNETNMRSAFLYWPDVTIIRGNETQQNEAIKQFESGKSSTGSTASFRVMADVIFLNDESDILRNIDPSKIRRLKELLSLFPPN